MRTIKENNDILKGFNCRITILPAMSKNIYSIMKVSENGNWFERLTGSDVLEIVMSSTDYLKISNKVNEIIKIRSTGSVSAK